MDTWVVYNGLAYVDRRHGATHRVRGSDAVSKNNTQAERWCCPTPQERFIRGNSNGPAVIRTELSGKYRVCWRGHLSDEL